MLFNYKNRRVKAIFKIFFSWPNLSIVSPEVMSSFFLKDKPLIKFKSHLYYEEKDGQQENLKALKPLPGSQISYFLNGKSLGVAFTDIYAGEYHPSIGLYRAAHVKFNFGPRFKFAPPATGGVTYRPMCERARDLEVEQAMADMRFFSENSALKIDDYYMTA